MSSPISVSELESTTSIKPEQFLKAKSPNSFAIINIFRKKICFNNILVNDIIYSIDKMAAPIADSSVVFVNLIGNPKTVSIAF